MSASPPRRLVVYLPHRRSLWRLATAELEAIRRATRNRFVVETPQTEPAFIRALPEAEILFVWGLSRRHVDKARSLRWLHTPVAGVDRVLNPELLRTKIRVTSSRGVNSVAVAEHALGLILSLTRGIAVAARAQVRGRWIQEEFHARRPSLEELDGKILGIYGLGAVGRALAPRGRALGMTVWAVTRRAHPKARGVDCILPAARSDRLLRRADVLVLTLPLTRETRGLIGERQLRRMKPSALLINVGRGEVIQESVLIRALRERWIAGAGLDVLATEPLARGSPLWTLSQVVLTPHVAGLHPDYMRRAADLFLRNLKSYLAGKRLVNEVDRQVGY